MSTDVRQEIERLVNYLVRLADGETNEEYFTSTVFAGLDGGYSAFYEMLWLPYLATDNGLPEVRVVFRSWRPVLGRLAWNPPHPSTRRAVADGARPLLDCACVRMRQRGPCLIGPACYIPGWFIHPDGVLPGDDLPQRYVDPAGFTPGQPMTQENYDAAVRVWLLHSLI